MEFVIGGFISVLLTGIYLNERLIHIRKLLKFESNLEFLFIFLDSQSYSLFAVAESVIEDDVL